MKKTDIRIVDDARGSPHETGFKYGDLEIDYINRMVFVKDREIILTGTEYKILTCLAQNAGRVITPQHILEKVWGQKFMDKPDRLRVNVSRLRKKLNNPSKNTEYIFTQPGLGYLMKEKV